VTLRGLNRALLARQLLLERAKLGPVEAIERLAGMQAQVPRPPFVGLWTRLAGFERPALAKALRDKQVVRATFVRGTLHLVSRGDYVALRAAIQPMLSAGMQAILKARASSIDLAKLGAFARTQLPATFDALRPALVKKFPRSDERALGYAVRMTLPLVQVPTEDAWAFPGNAAFADAEGWIGAPLGAPSPELLVKRYLAAFGPATVKDAERWSALKGLAPVFEQLRGELVTFRDGKRELFDLRDAPRPDEGTPAPVRFVPEYDNLVLGHDDRKRIVADEHRAQLVTKNLMVKATFLVDGFVAGTWTIERTGKQATLVLSPFGKLTKAARGELEAEGEALVRFVEPDAQAAVKLG